MDVCVRTRGQETLKKEAVELCRHAVYMPIYGRLRTSQVRVTQKTSTFLFSSFPPPSLPGEGHLTTQSPLKFLSVSAPTRAAGKRKKK